MLMIRHKLIIFFLLISTSIVFAGNYQSAELDELFQKLAKNHDPSYGSSLEKKNMENLEYVS